MTVPVNDDPRRTQGNARARVQLVELAAPERGAVDDPQARGRTRQGGTTIVRPGALTQLLADLARAPEGAGWDVPLEPGQTVGRFEIQREIGRGGFGVVYEARDTELGRSVAFKAVRASGADAAREARALGEAEAAARLAHPNIVHLYDLGQKSLEPKRLLWAALSVAAAALVGAGTFAYFWQRPLPPGRVLTALADTDNQTGDPDLDGVSELLRTGLEQSKRGSIMARSRLMNALREIAGSTPGVIDEALARRAAEHAQARIMIVPAARQTGAGFDLSLRAVDLARGEPLFQVQETAQGKGSVPEALQRLVAGARKAFREDAGEAKEAPISVAAIAPANPEALRHYAEGRRLESAGDDQAAEAYRRALEADPDFPLAHLELAFWYERRDFEATLRHIDAARRNLQRLPPKERVLVDAIATIYGDVSHFELRSSPRAAHERTTCGERSRSSFALASAAPISTATRSTSRSSATSTAPTGSWPASTSRTTAASSGSTGTSRPGSAVTGTRRSGGSRSCTGSTAISTAARSSRSSGGIERRWRRSAVTGARSAR